MPASSRWRIARQPAGEAGNDPPAACAVGCAASPWSPLFWSPSMSCSPIMVLPRLWTHYEHEPGLAGRPMVTVTADGIPGDPLNVGLVGTEEEAIRALAAAGWYPADAVTLRTSIEIAGSVIFDRPYRHAPVSPLFYEGRKQDFAFEKPVGNSADRRNHVRFWRTLERGAEGRPVFLGSATFDRGAGDQPLHRRDHPPHRPRHRCRARPPDRRPCRREHADARSIRSPASA